MMYFDYESAASRAGVPAPVLAVWRAGFEREYPNDVMMVELRLLRACEAAQGAADQLESVIQALEDEFRQTDRLLA